MNGTVRRPPGVRRGGGPTDADAVRSGDHTQPFGDLAGDAGSRGVRRSVDPAGRRRSAPARPQLPRRGQPTDPGDRSRSRTRSARIWTTSAVGAELQRLYAVDDRTIAPADGAGPVRECDKQLWSVVAATLPASVRPYLKELVVFDALLDERNLRPLRRRGGPGRHGRRQVAARGRPERRDRPGGRRDDRPRGRPSPQPQPPRNSTRPASRSARRSGPARAACATTRHFIRLPRRRTGRRTRSTSWNDAADASPTSQARPGVPGRSTRSTRTRSSTGTPPPTPSRTSRRPSGSGAPSARASPLLPQTIEGDPSNGKAKLDWLEQSADVKNHVLGRMPAAAGPHPLTRAHPHTSSVTRC